MESQLVTVIGVSLIVIAGVVFVIRKWGTLGSGTGGRTAPPKWGTPPVKGTGTGTVTPPPNIPPNPGDDKY